MRLDRVKDKLGKSSNDLGPSMDKVRVRHGVLGHS